jgi:hypothetical protein
MKPYLKTKMKRAGSVAQVVEHEALSQTQAPEFELPLRGSTSCTPPPLPPKKREKENEREIVGLCHGLRGEKLENSLGCQPLGHLFSRKLNTVQCSAHQVSGEGGHSSV